MPERRIIYAMIAVSPQMRKAEEQLQFLQSLNILIPNSHLILVAQRIRIGFKRQPYSAFRSSFLPFRKRSSYQYSPSFFLSFVTQRLGITKHLFDSTAWTRTCFQFNNCQNAALVPRKNVNATSRCANFNSFINSDKATFQSIQIFTNGGLHFLFDLKGNASLGHVAC